MKFNFVHQARLENQSATHAIIREYSPSLYRSSFVANNNVAPQTGLEPVTHGLTVHRSTN